jgi:broad specificity phosphatase PhoE
MADFPVPFQTGTVNAPPPPAESALSAPVPASPLVTPSQTQVQVPFQTGTVNAPPTVVSSSAPAPAPAPDSFVPSPDELKTAQSAPDTFVPSADELKTATGSPEAINPIKDFSAQEIADEMKKPDFSLLSDFDRLSDSDKYDPALRQKAADAYNLAKQYGERNPLAGMSPSKAAAGLADWISGLARWGYHAVKAVPSSGGAPGLILGLTTTPQEKHQALMELGATLETAATSTAATVKNAFDKALRQGIPLTPNLLGGPSIPLATSLKNQTPEQRLSEFNDALNIHQATTDALSGKGAMMSIPAVEHAKQVLEDEGFPVRPDVVAKLVPGEPLSNILMWEMFKGVGEKAGLAARGSGLSGMLDIIQKRAGDEISRATAAGLEKVGTVAPVITKGVEKIAPVGGGVGGLVSGGPVAGWAGWKAGQELAEKLATKVTPLLKSAKGVGAEVRAAAEGKPIASPYARALYDAAQSAPAAVRSALQGAAFDLGYSQATTSLPEERQGIGIGTVMGAGGGLLGAAGRVIGGQIVGKRPLFSNIPRTTNRSQNGQPNFPALEALHRASVNSADPTTRAIVNAVSSSPNPNLDVFYVPRPEDVPPPATPAPAPEAQPPGTEFHEINNPEENPNGKPREEQNQILEGRRKQVSDFINGLDEGYYEVTLEGSDEPLAFELEIGKKSGRRKATTAAGGDLSLEAYLGWGRSVNPDGSVTWNRGNIRRLTKAEWLQRSGGATAPPATPPPVPTAPVPPRLPGQPPPIPEADPLIQALVDTGRSPEQAALDAKQDGVTFNAPNADGTQRKVVVFRNPDTAPHEIIGHGMETQIGPEANKVLDQIVRADYTPEEWDTFKKNYAQRLNDNQPLPEGVTPDTFIQQRTGMEPDGYIARELRAENADAWFKHTGPALAEGKSWPEWLANIGAHLISAFGGEPLAGRTSDYGTPLRFRTLKAVAGAVQQAAGVKPELVTPKIGIPKGAPRIPVTAEQKQKAAEEAQQLVTSTAEPNAKTIQQHVADAISGSGTLRIDTQKEAGKLFQPYRTWTTKTGQRMMLGIDPNIFEQNAHQFARYVADHPELHDLVPFKIDPSKRSFTDSEWDRFHQEAAKYFRNQQSGFTGTGEPLVVPAKTAKMANLFSPEQIGKPEPVDQRISDLMNHLVGSTGELSAVPKTNEPKGGNLPRNIQAAAIARATGGEERITPTGREFAGPAAEHLGAKLGTRIAGEPIVEVNPLRVRMRAASPELPAPKNILQNIDLGNVKKSEPAVGVENRRINTLTSTAGYQPRQLVTPEAEKQFSESKVRFSDGTLKPVFHATVNPDFTPGEINTDGFSAHFGSPGQAADRVLSSKTGIRTPLAEEEEIPPGARVMPAFLDIRKPLETGDAGNWGNAENVSYFVGQEVKLPLHLRELEVRDRINKESDHLNLIDDIKDFLRSKGYDGIAYHNVSEEEVPKIGPLGGEGVKFRYKGQGEYGEGLSYIPFDQSQVFSAIPDDKGQYQPVVNPRAIRTAAVKDENTGKVYEGAFHGGAMLKYLMDTQPGMSEDRVWEAMSSRPDVTEGWVTHTPGEFLDRDQGQARAQEAAQMPKGYAGLPLESTAFEREKKLRDLGYPLGSGQYQPKPIEIEGPDGKKYKATFDGMQDFSSLRPGMIVPQITPLEDLPGSVIKGSTTYGPSLTAKGYKLPSDLGAPPVAQTEQKGAVNAGPVPTPPKSPPNVAGSKVSAPVSFYHEAEKNEGNPWVRQSDSPDNSGRTLMVQFSSDLLGQKAAQTGARDESAAYYDKLYSGARPGYSRLQDFWEIPQWQGYLAHFEPNADSYTVRNMDEAKQFLNSAGYGHVAFSSLDVNKDLIRELASSYPGNLDVGGYAEPHYFSDIANVRFHPTMESFAKELGVPYKAGVDYRHFAGSDVIPRLTMSQGCRHKCAFCTVEKKVTETPPDVVNQQADAIAKLGSKLVYLNDKTFGQASNYKDLAGLNDQIKEKNPNFKGFVVQTTAAQLRSIPSEWLAKSGIKFVEIGVETYNDPILKAQHKPATESLIDQSVQKLRENHIALIPNIIIGLPGETPETYGRTLEWLKNNQDIISHANIYNLAIYKDAELGKTLTTASPDDFNENVLEKSFHTNPKVHRQFAGEAYGLAHKMLEGKPSEAQFQPKADEPEKIRDMRTLWPGLPVEVPAPAQQQQTQQQTQPTSEPVTLVVRHGSTEMNSSDPAKDLIRGWKDVPLDEKGRQEAKDTAAKIAPYGLNAIITSDLGRTRETADEIAKQTGAPVISEPDFRPWKLGPTIEGKPTQEMLPKISSFAEKPDERPPGGESFNEFKNRFLGAFHKWQDAYPDKNTALVTHYRGTKLLDAWRATGTDNDTIDKNLFEEYNPDKKPGHFDVLDKTGAESQYQPSPASAKKEKEDKTQTPLVHYSNVKGLATLEPEYHGTGFGGAEKNRAKEYPELYVPRTYFGMQGYQKERGLGDVRYKAEVRAGKLYNIEEDPKNLYPSSDELEKAGYAPMDQKAALSMYEKRIHDAGYEGYLSPSNNAVAKFTSTKVKPIPAGGQFQPVRAPKEEDFKDEKNLKDTLQSSRYAILTATQEGLGKGTDEVNVQANKNLESALIADGFEPIPVSGSYKGTDQGASFIVPGMTPQEAQEWGNRYNQESVLIPEGLLYANNTIVPAKHSETIVGPRADEHDFSSKVEGGPAFSTGHDWNAPRIPFKSDLPSQKAQQLSMFGGPTKEVLSSAEVGGLTKKEAAEHYPEAVIPKSWDDKIEYGFDKTPLYKQAGNEPEAVKQHAAKLVAFAKEHETEPAFKSGARWYSDFVPKLKQTYGKGDEMMAQLLAATSPRNSPQPNFAMANEALDGYLAGRYNKQIGAYLKGLEMLEGGKLKNWYDKRVKSGKVADAPQNPSDATYVNEWISANDLRPRQANGKLFGMHSIPVLQVLAGTWLTENTGPKTLQFVKNLLGLDNGPTIDVWAARTLHRTANEGLKDRWRILPGNETGVSDSDFEYGQKVFKAAAKELGMEPAALQGALWFAEKSHWADQGWARLDLGDFRKEIQKAPYMARRIEQRLRETKATPSAVQEELITPRQTK